ncbi:MAG: hypothetical protein M3Z33_07360 [Actinomycetota bacterium]|nr:hypothetical protein [Actinomycetota bacterium]
MTRFLGDLWQDLLEKRLWPVAVALVAAAVAVPVLLGKSPAHELAPAPARPPAAVSDARLLSGTPVKVGPTGFRDSLSRAPLKDPFKQQHVPAPPNSTIPRLVPNAPSNPSASLPGAGGTSSTGGGSGGGSSGGGGTSPRPAPATGTKLRLRFGIGGGALKTYEMSPLTALPSASSPVVIYLGLLKDGKTASFLVSSDSNPQGDGKCKPSSGVCQTLLMKEGDTEFLDIDQGAGAAQYQLEVDRIIRG